MLTNLQVKFLPDPHNSMTGAKTLILNKWPDLNEYKLTPEMVNKLEPLLLFEIDPRQHLSQYLL